MGLKTWLRRLRGFVLRVLLSGVGSGAVVGIACLGLTLTTAPRWINLVFEPFSLLLLPGILCAIAWTIAKGLLETPAQALLDNHDYSPPTVVVCTLLFYFVLLCWLLLRSRRASAATVEGGSA